jgi:inner membrane protein
VDFITHVLAGACIARAGLNRKTKLATVTVVLAAEAPDLDVLARLKGPISGFAHDRGSTHSFLGVAVVSGAVVCVIYALFRLIGSRIKDPRLGPRWGLLLGFAYLAGLTHILLDFTDNYGVRPYWPFSDRWYSWDIGLLIDPVAAILLFGGLMLSVLSSLMNAEHGRSRKVPVGRLAAGLALMGVVAVWGIRDYEHRRALHALEVRQYRGAKPLRTSAFPSWWNPFLWRGVVETPNFVASIRVNSSSQELAALDETQIRYKPQETPETLAAKNTYLGRAYMNWARHPITETEPLELGERGYIVRISDLRFERAGREHYFPSASVRLNRDLSIADMSFGEQDPPY